MEKETSLTDVIAEATFSAIKEIAARKETLSVSGISSMISGNAGIRKIIEDLNKERLKPEKEDKSESGPLREEAAIKTELARLQSQKVDLLRHLAEVEEQVGDQGRAYRKFLQFLADNLKNYGNLPFSGELDGFRNALRQDDEFPVIEKSFGVLKDAFLKASDHHDQSGREKTGFLDRLFKKTSHDDRPQPTDIELYKGAYLDLVNELRLSLGQEYLERFRDVSKNIERAGRFDDLNVVRSATIGIIRDYIRKISLEREDAASFIREVGARLIEIENHFMGAYSDSEKNHTSNRAFGSTLENHFDDIRQGLDSCKTLEELKSVVVSKLSVISEAIKSKSSNDDQARNDTEKRMSYLRSGIDQMKHEIDAANSKARKLEMELLRDSLTGAFNRRAYERKMQEEYTRYRRYKSPYSVLVFDVDLFKGINDRFGHMVGDRCLQEIIKRVQPVLRDSDMVARYGGEEFVVILPETVIEGSLEVAEKIRRTVEATEFMHKDEKVSITVSVGASQITEADPEPEYVFARADEAMYVAKKSGRNRVSSKM